MEKRDNKQDKAIIVLENNYLHMSEQIKDLKHAVESGLTKINNKLDCIVKESDAKYASKQTEIVVNGLVGLIVSAVVIALIALVVK
jgi:hypothetical protein